MRVIDLMNMVCLHSYQKSVKYATLYKGNIPDKEEYCKEMLEAYTAHHTFGMDDNTVCIGWNYNVFQQKGFINEEDLNSEVKDGYWVYTLFTSTDDIFFERFDSKSEAFKRYQKELKSFKSNRREDFTGVVDALFIDTYRNKCVPDVSVLMKQSLR